MYDSGLQCPKYNAPAAPKVDSSIASTKFDPNYGGAKNINPYEAGGGIGAGIATAMGQPWFAPIILLAGNVLGSMFSRREQPQLTPEQAWFRDLTRFYSDLGKRSSDMRRIGGAMGLSADKVAGIGYNSTHDAIKATIDSKIPSGSGALYDTNDAKSMKGA